MCRIRLRSSLTPLVKKHQYEKQMVKMRNGGFGGPIANQVLIKNITES
jgi:hypothetical protein